MMITTKEQWCFFAGHKSGTFNHTGPPNHHGYSQNGLILYNCLACPARDQLCLQLLEISHVWSWTHKHGEVGQLANKMVMLGIWKTGMGIQQT